MKKWVVPLLAGALIALVSYGVGQYRAHHVVPPALAQLQDVSWLARELDLTEAQMDSVRALGNEYGQQIVDLCAAHCAARNELAVQLIANGWDAISEEECVRRMGEAQMKSDLLTLEHMQRVSDVLRPEQRGRYERLVAASLNQACPHQLHHGALTREEHRH